MRVILQRSKESSVTIDNVKNGQINQGLVILVGFTHGDNNMIVDKMIDKIINLRIFEDDNGKMNRSLLDIKGEVLSISQFTLYANCKEGRRPSFTEALNPIDANNLYNYFNEKLKKFVCVQTGKFGCDMLVKITNDGPVTIFLDSNTL